MRKLYFFLVLLCCSFYSIAQVSVTATAGTTGPTSYTTVNAAFTAINAGTHQGAITITVTANTTEPATPVPLLQSGTGASTFTSILIKPQGNVSISSAAAPVTNRGILELAGADNVTINGDDASTAGTQNLTIQSVTATTAGIAVIRLSSNSTSGADGANNNTIRNCIIIGSRSSATSTTNSYGIQFSNGTSTSSSTGGAYSSLNTVIENNTISRALFGINAIGASASYLNTGTIIRNNIIGSSIAAENIGGRGINISYTSSSAGAGSVIIEGNDIRVGEVDASAAGYALSIYGVHVDAANAGAIIRKNNIHDVIQPSTSGYLAAGIGITSATSNAGIEIYNNFIRDMVASRYSTAQPSSFVNYGIWINAAVTGLKINHNTIALLKQNVTGTTVNYTSGCIAISSTSATVAELQNNIFVNMNASSRAFSVFTSGTGTILASASMSNNAYYSNSIGYYNSVNYATLADWQTATGKDANSIFYNPNFVSATDIHIPNTPSKLESGGIAGTITTDIDGQTRPGPAGSVNGGGTAPDIGADEFDGMPIPAIDIIPSALVKPGTTGCEGTSVPVSVNIKNTGSTIINFATNSVSISASVTGAATATLTGTVSTGTLDPDSTLEVNLSALNMPVSGSYNFKIVTTTTGDGYTPNDTLYATSTVATPVSLPQTVNFTGYTGTNLTAVAPNWYEATGATAPVNNSGSAWLEQTGWSPANTTLRINLYTNTRNEWIVGPKFQATANSKLKFDVAITDFAAVTTDPAGMQGTDDKVIVKVSTDCGATFTDAYVFDASTTTGITNVLTQQTVDLSSYAGQNVIVAFFASDGPTDDAPDYDFHIDNILLENALPNDMGAVAIIAPAEGQCYTATETVTVTIKNQGSAAINFATTPVTVTTNVTGAATTTLSAVVNSGTLAPDATLDVNMSATLNMTGVGTYSFKAYTTLTGDANAANDTTVATRTGHVALPETVSFTGFTGANLTTVFPNWNEAKGATVPSGTTSNWINTTLGTGNTTAKINLYFNTANDWIVGPKFMATSASRLKFDIAITDFGSTAADPAGMQGTDDKVVVKVSTDCGATYTDLFVMDASNTAAITNSLVQQVVDLSTFAGQIISLAFFATDGTTNDAPDYDFHIDNINIENGPTTDLGATAILSPASAGCFGSTEQVRVVVKNFGIAPINFATTPVTVTTEVTGAANTTLSGVLNSGSVAPNDTISVVMSATLNMAATGTYTFKAFSTITGDASAVNDTLSGITRTTTAAVSLPQSVDFTGFTGANLNTLFPNWNESVGVTRPSGTTSLWTNQAGWAGGNVTAKVNLYTNNRNEWIVGPKFVAAANSRLKFDVAITDFAAVTADAAGMQGTDDSVKVKISTDCGATYQDLYVFDAANTSGISNTLVPQLIDLSTYAGQNVIIAFVATDGPVDNTPDYDFHIDNVLIENAVANDAGAVALIAPTSGDQCYTATEAVTVTIKNFGTAPLDFSVSPVTVTTQVTGASSTTLTATVNSGILAPDATLDVTMNGTLNMTVAGTFNFKAYTTLTGDGISTNDTVMASRTSHVVLPETIDFTGFTGTNLTALFPNWREGAGATSPAGTTSLWGSQATWSGGNTTAKINLYLDNRNEWIVGPRFMAAANTQLQFDIAITDFASTAVDPAGMQGTDDKVVVKISTDCGVTFQDLQVYNASNTASISNILTTQTIDLSSYAGQIVIIAFFASDGPVNDAPDYDFHIDNVTIQADPLPVTLVEFKGEKAGTANRLTWTTSTEVNNNGFELERSADGRNFTAIAFISSKGENGNSNSTLNYNYNDVRPLAGNNYYRLKQVDKDGKTTFSNVVLLSSKVADITLSSVYPNPATRSLNLVITSPRAEKVTLIVSDMTGKVLMQTGTQLVIGDNQQTFNVQQLAAGTYFIKAVCASGCETAAQRFVKQ